MRAVTRSRSKAVNQDLPLVVEGDDEDANNDMDHKRNEDVDNTGEAAQYEEDDHNDAPNLEEIAELESMAQVRHEQRRDPTWKPVIDHI
jgi:hypothetical protein